MAITVTGSTWLGRLVDAILPPPQNSGPPPEAGNSPQMQALCWAAEIGLTALCLGIVLRGRKPVRLSGGRGIGLLGRRPIGLGRSPVLKKAGRFLRMAEQAEPPKPPSRFLSKTKKWQRDGWNQDISRPSHRTGRRR